MTDTPRKRHPDVTRVLLADGWHEVDQQTFELDGHSFGFGELVPVEGEHGELTATGRFITGPLTSVLAVESERKRLFVIERGGLTGTRSSASA